MHNLAFQTDLHDHPDVHQILKKGRLLHLVRLARVDVHQDIDTAFARAPQSLCDKVTSRCAVRGTLHLLRRQRISPRSRPQRGTSRRTSATSYSSIGSHQQSLLTFANFYIMFLVGTACFSVNAFERNEQDIQFLIGRPLVRVTLVRSFWLHQRLTVFSIVVVYVRKFMQILFGTTCRYQCF
jgi:hypothetical protein